MKPSTTTLRHYYMFWLGQQLSSVGSSIVSFILIWWITITTGSAIYLAIASAASFGTMMLIQFVSGYLTDYFDRKTILVLVDMLQAIATLALMLLFYLGLENIMSILLILAIRGIFDGLHMPAKGAILPSMVPENKLQRVNSLSSMARSIINLMAPPVAALLLLVFTPSKMWLLLSIDAITFVVALLPMLFIAIPDVRQQQTDQESLWTKLSGGITFLRQSRGLMPLLLIFATFNFFITPISMLTPLIIYSERGFASTEFYFALSVAVGNAGMLFMSTILSKFDLPVPSPIGIMLGFSITTTGLLSMGYAILSHNLVLFIASNFVIGTGFPIVNVFSSMIWQSQVPGHLQGRVISVRMILVTMSLPLVVVMTGFIAELVDFGVLFLVSSFSFAAIFILIWLFTDFRNVEVELTTQLGSSSPTAAGD